MSLRTYAPDTRATRIRVALAELADLLASEPAAPTAPPVVVSIEEAARLLGVSRRTVYNLVGSGALPSLHVGARHLVRVADLETFATRKAAGALGTPPTAEPEVGDATRRPAA